MVRKTGMRKSSRSSRGKLRSPGRPPVVAPAARRPLWEAIARGLTSEDAARVAGVSPPVGARWFRHHGGMPPSHLCASAPVRSGRYLSLREREALARLHAPGHGIGVRDKHGPALAGHGATAVREAIARTIVTLPPHLRQSLTWDHGAERAQHAQLRVDSGRPIYFCDPHRPWQRGTNENTNGLLRPYFPKGTDFQRLTMNDLNAVALTLNTRPRKTLGWRTPADALDELRPSHSTVGVATTS